MAAINLQNIIVIFLGGGVGASLRFLFSYLLTSLSGRPWLGTLFVNLLGTLIFFLVDRFFQGMKAEYQLMIKTGLLGSLTTFSTFSFEVVQLFKSGRLMEGLSVVLLNVVFGIIIGIWIFK